MEFGSLDQLRFGDVLDVLAVGVLVYLALHWLSRTTYRRLAFGLVPLVGALFVARAAQMYMTLRLLQIGLAVTAVALIVVFQEEIRRGFERLAAPKARTRSTEPLGLVQETVEAAFAMAKKRTGALIVFEGREPLSRLISAGIQVDGRVSSVLLRSIFEPSSPGHDGAAVIESGRLSRFAVHLPLAKGTVRDVSGTRHAAALGISQRSDALALVVSEEHGDVSVARAGRLAPVASPEELTDHLASHLTRRTPPSAPARIPKLLRPAALAALAFATAGLLWALFGDRSETVQRTYTIPIEYRNAPENLLLEPPVPPSASVTLSGPRQAVAATDTEALALGIEASTVTPGRQAVRLSGDMLELSPGVAVVAMEPERVDVVATELVAVTLPVRLRTTEVPAGFDLEALVAEPSELSIWLPRSLVASVDHLESVRFDPLQLRDSPREVAIQLPEGARATEGEATVRVRLDAAVP